MEALPRALHAGDALGAQPGASSPVHVQLVIVQEENGAGRAAEAACHLAETPRRRA